jgi:hypothetical protein
MSLDTGAASFSHTSHAYPVAVDAFASSRPLTIGTRSTNWASLLGGLSRKMASYRPTLYTTPRDGKRPQDEFLG